MRSNKFAQVVDQIKNAVIATSTDPNINDADLRNVLGFLTKVVQVIDQSFQDVYTLAIELAYLDPNDVGAERVRRLQKELDLLLATSHYRESLEICSRLKHLKLRFEQYILPTISHLQTQTDWRQLFWLIEDREGRIIQLVEGAADELRRELQRARAGDVSTVNRAARKLADELRPLLAELREMTNEILGLSGPRGFLELTRDRSELSRAASIVVNHGAINMARDIFNVERAGAVGPHSSATNTTFIEQHSDPLAGADLAVLSAELARLKATMQMDAKRTEHYAALAAVSEAEDAAKIGDKTSVATKLKAAGTWAFDVATKIGVSVAAKAIQVAMGIP
jgi:hypothetical protein